MGKYTPSAIVYFVIAVAAVLLGVHWLAYVFFTFFGICWGSFSAEFNLAAERRRAGTGSEG